MVFPPRLQPETANVRLLNNELEWDLVDIKTEEILFSKHEICIQVMHYFKHRKPKVSKAVSKFTFFPQSRSEWNSA